MCKLGESLVLLPEISSSHIITRRAYFSNMFPNASTSRRLKSAEVSYYPIDILSRIAVV